MLATILPGATVTILDHTPRTGTLFGNAGLRHGRVPVKNRVTATIVGVIVSAVGVLWILQGFDALGQSGGMNGKKTWSWIGFVVLVAGLALIYVFNSPRAKR